METNENYVKIHFSFYSIGSEEQTVETMWAEVIDQNAGTYELNNIPFYAPDLASGDLISAVYNDQEEMLTYKETISYSGNSTIQVAILDKISLTNDIRETFQDLGCETEKFKEGYFVMNVPFDLDYGPIRAKLIELSEKGTIDYAEPCLSAKHGNAT
ncbi:DUF4265 domain-containing protein [Pedobacter immunditicola]|uniref:DUF4265 domain-containing protein n=1 Tax=Pedobacter immunditicola TaxID=3133440 RepID=UPI00309F8C02